MANPPVILTPLASQSATKVLPPLTDSAAGIGRMSQQQGFPPITQEPLETGGKAPQRDDFNGAFNLLSEHTVFLQSGGHYLYNSALTYNLGNIIALNDGVTLVQSLVDNNPNDPNAGLGTTWKTADAAEVVRTWARRFAGVGITVLANTVLTPDQVGNWVEVNSNSVLTLPAVDVVPVGSTFVVRNSNPSFTEITVNSLGGNVGGAVNFLMGYGELIEFAADPTPGRGWWITARSQAHDSFTGTLIGTPIPYPISLVPNGYLAMAGQPFNPATYPNLSFVYPSNVLPDLRGVFIRGWDNFRGTDPGRVLLSPQDDALQNIIGSFQIGVGAGSAYCSTASGAFLPGVSAEQSFTQGTSNLTSLPYSTTFNASRSARTASETRPKNTAFHYICRAK